MALTPRGWEFLQLCPLKLRGSAFIVLLRHGHREGGDAARRGQHPEARFYWTGAPTSRANTFSAAVIGSDGCQSSDGFCTAEVRLLDSSAGESSLLLGLYSVF